MKRGGSGNNKNRAQASLTHEFPEIVLHFVLRKFLKNFRRKKTEIRPFRFPVNRRIVLRMHMHAAGFSVPVSGAVFYGKLPAAIGASGPKSNTGLPQFEIRSVKIIVVKTPLLGPSLHKTGFGRPVQHVSGRADFHHELKFCFPPHICSFRSANHP